MTEDPDLSAPTEAATPEGRVIAQARRSSRIARIAIGAALVSTVVSLITLVILWNVSGSIGESEESNARDACTTVLVGRELGLVIASLRVPIEDRPATLDVAEQVAGQLQDPELCADGEVPPFPVPRTTDPEGLTPSR